ncbi:MAG TPA: TadE/TadG family type IV pilus assembly protein [Pirellulales bacterium]|jgi:Flp pilus assembly protein TadG|nr:TadE/TadG family type IV pilus assembly protein [Pirellulales bacterium]
MIRHRKTRLHARRGTAAVEAAMVLPITLLFMFGIIEYGRYVMTLQIVTSAARAGARYALTHVQPVVLNGVTYGNATTDVQNVVNTYLAGQSLSSQNVQVFASTTTGQNTGAWTSAEAGQSICVEITGNYVPLITMYLYLPSSIPMSVESVVRVEST